jgi:dephospho-CoA kinase
MLIGLCALKESGKSTVTNFLIKNYDFKEYALALPIKELSKQLFLFDQNQLYGNQKEIIDEKWNVTPRHVFQKCGYFLRTEFGKDFFIKKFKLWYTENKHKNIVVSDIRFPNELKAIKELGGIVIKINRFKTNQDMDISEQHILSLKSDFEIDNSNSLDELFSQVTDIMANLIV